jgi:hypothetical protein
MFLGYNYCIMQRLFGLKAGYIVGAAIGISVVTILFVAYKQHDAAQKYKTHRKEYCASRVTTAEQKKACEEEGADASDYLPWGYKLIAWPEGITTWAIIATGFFIAWQSWETRKAAKAVENQTREVALQNSNMVAKERARVDITFPRETSKLTISMTSRTLMTSLSVNIINNGGSVAYDISGGYDAFASTDEEPPPSKDIFVLETPANLQDGGEEPIGPMKVDARYGKGTPYTFYIYVRGYIEYRIVFEKDRKRRTDFLLRREFISNEGDKASSTTWWEPCGKPEDNQST